MSRLFEELDYCPTPMGPLVLRRRWDGRLDKDVYEIKLGDDFLMSSHFTASEIALADLALAETRGDGLTVAVGGLGLGYTAQAALRDSRVRSMVVLEALEPVIEWHAGGLLPIGRDLASDKRCRFVHGDFFRMVRSPETGLDPLNPATRFDAILLDIDHSPADRLDEDNAPFYTAEGLGALSAHLKPGAVFALWSNEPEDPRFTEVLASVFAEARGEAVTFANPLQQRETTQTIYLARRAPAD